MFQVDAIPNRYLQQLLGGKIHPYIGTIQKKQKSTDGRSLLLFEFICNFIGLGQFRI